MESKPLHNRFQLSLVAAIALSLNAAADEPKPQPVRTLIEHHDQSGVPGKEIVIGTAMLPHDGYNESHAHKTISTGVVSHTVNFHDRFDASQWLLLANESVWAGRGRTQPRCPSRGR